MPQMAPLWWSFLYIFFFFLVMTFVVVIYTYVFVNKAPSMEIKTTGGYMTWSW